MAELAQTYAGLAGDERAKSRFGGLAVSADIDALRAAHQTLTPAVRSSAAAVAEHGNAMAEAHSLARGLAGSLGGLWLTYGSLIPLAAGAAIAASLKNVVTVGAEVEHQLTNVLALTKSSVNLDQFLSVSDGSLRSLTEGANAMRMLAQNGLNAGQSLQILPAILDLATVGEMNVGQAALAATGAASAFGLSYSEAGRIADIFAVTAANSNTSVLAMTESMKQASTVASLFKVSIEETAAMLGLLAKINVTGGAAGTSMTNMLTGLYEPTQKGKKALKELGIETQMASGALKPLTQLLEEMRGALSGFSDSARVDLLGSIFTVRGVKSAQLALDNIDDFKKKTEEAANASGFMAGVVKKLEDDTTGGFERLGVVVQNSFVRSFQEASPFVQHIALTLSDMFKDGGAASNGLRNFSTNIARVTGALAENLDAVTLLAGGYVAMRALGPVTGLVLEAISASVAHTTAVAAETAAMAAVTTANLGAGASAELVTAAVTAQATATEAAALAAAKLDAALLPVLGAVGIAVGVAAAAWLLFRDNTSEADRANQQIENSLSVVSEALEREIKQLEKSNSLWNEREGRYNAPETSVESDVKKAESAVTRLETEARNKAGRLNIDPEQYLKSLRSGQAFGSDQLAAQLRQADSNLAQWREKARITEEDLIPKKAIKGVHDATEQLNKELEAFYNQGMGSNSKGEFYQQNAAVRAVHQQALSLASQLTDAPKGATPEAEMARIAAIKTDLKQLQDQSNALRNSHADTGDKDAARTRIEQLQEELRLKQMLAKSEIDTAKGQNKRGELGDLQLINYELVKKLEVDQKAVEVARAQLAAAGPLKGSQQQRYQNAVTTAEAQMGVDRAAAERQKQDVLDQMAGKELEARAKALESQGRLQDAFNITWEAKHANVLANLSRDIADAQNADYRDALVRYQNYLGEQRRLGQNDARFKEGQNAFGAADATLRAKLEDARNQAGPGSGLYSTLNSSVLEQGAYGDMIPQLQAAQAKVAASSSKLFGGDDAKLKVAQDELRKIQSAMAAMRNTAVDMGEAIARALTDAFGKGGAAMGSMIVAATNYGVKMQEIDATLAASKGTEADRAQAAAATASAQIKGYGDMAGAAKGFFDQNSNGYRILHTTEQAFRAFELAQAAMALGKKLFFKQTEVAATTALNGTKVAGEAASTAASTALAGTEASAWGITAVAKAIASLPFPFNLAAGAATMAAIVGLGIKMTGGFGGGSSAADRQAENGTGTIAGDPKAKTESLAKSLALVEKNTYNGLAVSYDMLHTLQAINSNISGFAGLILQNTDIANPDVRLSSGIGKTGWAQADLTATGAEIGLAVGGLAGAAVGAALGYVASKIPAVQKLYSSIFGGKQSLDDTGFMMSKTSLGDIASRGVNAQTYADITTSGGWFRSDKHNTQSNSAGDEANRAISQILLGMGDAVKSAGAILGLSGSEFDAKLNSFVVDIGKISLKGLSSSEQQAAIQSAFSKVGDQMAQSAVSTITQFSKAGEGALETLVRVATDYQAVDAVFASFGTTFAEVGVSSIAAREKLIDLAGGLDKFTSNAEFFFKNFLTEAQQTAANRAAITPTLGKYGLSTEGADAVKKFADLTIAMGAMGAAGAEAYTELMRIAPAFKAVTDVAKDLQDQIDDLMMTQAQKDAAARAALDPANRALFDQLQQAKAISQARSTLASSYQSEASSLQSAIDKLKSFSVSLKNFINTLQLSDASPLNPADKYGAALSLFNTTLAKAQAGDADAQGNLQSVMQSFLQASKAANASNSTYQSDYNRVTAAAAAMAATADKQATEGQTNLAALRQQISQLTTLNETSLSIVEAINNLAVAMTGGKDDKVNATAVESLYQELLGRSSDAGGAAFYTNLLKQGVSLSTVIEDIKSSSEYLTHIGQVPATTNVTPSTQYGTAPGTPSGGASVDIAGLYRQVLGRAPDQAGLDYWTGVAKSGASMENIKAAMMGGTEYQQSHVAPAVATDPYSGIAAQNTQIVAQLAKVNDHLDSLRTEQQQQADNQTAATFAAAAGTGEDVADALKETTREARWTNSNKLDLR
jgi:TP901 family phage tail tape measure protein